MLTALYKHDLWAFNVTVNWKHVNKACFAFVNKALHLHGAN